RQSLLVVSDNNFNPNHQITQFIAFALDIEPVPQPPLARFVSAPAIPFAAGPKSGPGSYGAARLRFDTDGALLAAPMPQF
ncbi:MAG: hypothetical protein MJA27_07135, partial [Pseudanabaenales cyanobacterium]|nr:hypothetical protein [Pseudanabaenales cyanobacterium]